MVTDAATQVVPPPEQQQENNESQVAAGGQSSSSLDDFLATMMREYQAQKQSDANTPPDIAGRHLNNPDYTPVYGPNGELQAVNGPDGKPVVTFENWQNGKPMTITYPDGHKYVSKDGGQTYESVAPDGAKSPFPITGLSVDDKGNITINHALDPDVRVTMTPDGTVILSPSSRAHWAERAQESTVKMSDDGRTMEVLDKDGKPIRTIHFDANGKPERIVNSDGSTWHTTDGGKTWWANGNQYYYSDANMQVDRWGNISYNTPYGERTTETIDGQIVRVKKPR